ncbi:acyltransferase domain-containing protein [Arthrobacter sp. S13_S34]|nr:acyltransferase domain-containing protein [Arthrobacter sp. S13_S34]
MTGADSGGIAIAGLGIRLAPDIDEPAQLWNTLTAGRSVSGAVISGVEGRRVAAPARNGEPGGLRHGIDQFDPAPFGIGRAEATDIDPQQRLVLEATWDCLADGEIGWQGLRGRSVGVFAGAYAQDWLFTQARGGAPFSGYVGTGTAHSMLANRLSYLLDVHGPSLTVDTACSSSLTALHLAVGALRRGECEFALVTAVALGFDDTYRSMTVSSLPFSPTAACRPFDAAADGIIRGEGAVSLLLELDRPGRRPSRATILGSAINHDGRTNGMTAPSAAAQARLLRAALTDARVASSQVAYLEAHGTGTILGDPIETKAIAAVYGERDTPLLIGSVKGTLGHLEAAAGLAGLAAAVLSLQHGEVPGQAGFEHANPALNLAGGSLAIAQHREPLRPDDLVAVSSFGFGGSNAHVVLGPGTRRATIEADDPSAVHVLALSAADAESLDARRESARLRLGEPGADRAGVLSRTTRGVTPQRHRYAWSGSSPEELAEAVQVQAGGRGGGRVSASARSGAIWVFSGQGSNWQGMADELLKVPRLRASWDRWEQEVAAATGWSLRDRLAAVDAGTTTHDQVTIAAVQLALSELLMSWQHRPAAVIGHSMGEVTAAVVAGTLTSEVAFAILAQRGRWIESAAGGGRMVSVALPATELATWLETTRSVGVAAINGPRSTVLSGTSENVTALAVELVAEGIPVRELAVTYAFHSPLLEAVAPTERTISPSSVGGGVPHYSTVTAARLDLELEPEHWWRNVREPVQFLAALTAALTETGSRCVVEIAPHPVLQRDIEAVAAQALPAEAVLVLAAARRQTPLRGTLGALAAGLFRHGLDLDLRALVPPADSWAEPVPYAWQRRRFWREAAGRAGLQASGTRPAAVQIDHTETAGSPAEQAGPAASEITAHVCELVSAALDDRPVVSPDVPLGEWELESLAVVTLRNAVEQRFGLTIPLPLLLDGPTPRELGLGLAPDLVTPVAADAEAAGADDPLDALTDAELVDLLAALETTAPPTPDDTRRGATDVH